MVRQYVAVDAISRTSADRENLALRIVRLCILKRAPSIEQDFEPDDPSRVNVTLREPGCVQLKFFAYATRT